MDSAASAINDNGNYQCRNRGGIWFGAAADRGNSADGRMEDGVLRCRSGWVAWVIWWSVVYRDNSLASIATLDVRLVAQQLSFTDVLSMRRVQVLVFAKFMSDSAWYFYLFWLPKYLYDVRGFDVRHVSYYAWIPYAASGVGSFLGGWLSSALLRRGRSLDFSRKFTVFGFRDLLEANAVNYVQFDTNRVGGISQARKISAMAEAYQIPVVPHAGQMHNYHVVMASLNSPMAEFFPKVDVEVGNELFWYIFDGEPVPVDGYIDLDESTPGLGLTVNEDSLKRFKIIE
jgi:hypothetical protein